MHISNKQEAFWASHSKRKPAGFYSTSFMDLINKMIASDPNKRPSILEIKEH